MTVGRRRKCARELLRVFRAAGRLRRSALASSGSWGWRWPGWAAHGRARALFRQALAFAREMGESLVTALHHLGNVELALGNLAEARRLYRELMALSEESGLSYGVVVGLTGLARVALRQGDLVGARAIPAARTSAGDAYTPDPAHDRGDRDDDGAHAGRGSMGGCGRVVRRSVELAGDAEICAESGAASSDGLAAAVASTGSADCRRRSSPRRVERGRHRQIDDVVAELVGG